MDIFSAILDSVFPRSCPVCGNVLAGDEPVCAACLALMPSAANIAPTRLRSLLEAGKFPMGITQAWFLYTSRSPYSQLIKEAKYYSRPSLAYDMGEAFANILISRGDPDINNVDVLMPSPMHYRRRMSRGYNQAEEIAKGIASVTGAAVADNLAARRRHTAQARSNREQRLKNLSDTMELMHPEELEGMNIALVDDVVTTGTTVKECIMTLSKAPVEAASLGILALAITQ